MHGPPWFPRRALRDDRYKLIHNLLAGTGSARTGIDGDVGYVTAREQRYEGTPIRRAFDILADPPEFELYDLDEDPWEFRNLADDPEHTATLERLQAALDDWRRTTNDPLLDPAFVEEMRQRVDSY